MVLHWSLSDCKSPQVSRTHLRILAVLSNAVVWVVSTRLPISKSSRPFNNPLVIVPNAPITIGTIVTFMFHSFFNSLARSRYLSFFSLSFRFILWSARTAKSTILLLLLFYLNFSHQWFLTKVRVTASLRKSPGLFSVLADLKNAVVWMVSCRLLIFKSSSPCTNPLVSVLNAPITIVITVTSMFHSVFNSLTRSRYLSILLSLNFTLRSAETAKSTIIISSSIIISYSLSFLRQY